MRRTRFRRPGANEGDTDATRVNRGPGSQPVTPRRPANVEEMPDNVMMFRYGPSARRRPTIDIRDMKFMDPKDREKLRPTPRASQPPARMPDEKELLQVKGVDLHIAENVKLHRTDKYEQTEKRRTDSGKEEEAELVVRRAQEFLLTLSFARPFDARVDNIHLVFEIGTMARPQWQTLVTVPVKPQPETDPKPEGDLKPVPDLQPGSTDPAEVKPPRLEARENRDWAARIVRQEGNTMTVSVYIAADCIIGEWDLSVYSIMHKPSERPQIFVYDHPDNIFILLNPWSPDDSVYMPETDLLEEYVLNDTGGIFVGNYKDFRPRPWFFGQFEDGILDITLHLLRRAFGYRISTKMADPTQISRALSKMEETPGRNQGKAPTIVKSLTTPHMNTQEVNANDDKGVVIGRWDGEYEDGKGPSTWTGSVSILDQYDKSGGAVKYGQCWVFAGVLNTVCRAVGLPTRVISNFKSAHDTDGNTTVDRHIKFDDKGDVVFLNERDKDSIWNFHVWNDAWMARPDLPDGFDGWQTIDATPQELSEGSFQCGPSPLPASQGGHIHLPYDTPFVFAEVNAHIVYWEVKTDAEWKQIHVDRFEVGKFISTKVPNGKPLTSMAWGVDNPDRLDVTADYKHPDGSPAEQAAMDVVTKQLELGITYEQPKKDLEVSLQDIRSIVAGEEVPLVAVVTNTTSKTLTVSAGLSATVITYNGVGIKDIVTQLFKKEKLKPGQKRVVEMKIGPQHYLGHLISNGSIMVRAQGRVDETGESFIRQDNFVVKPPELDVDVRTDGELETRKPFDLTISFRNPLDRALTGCRLELSGPGLMGRTYSITPTQETVPARQEFRETIRLRSRRAGIKELVITLDTNELPDIFGFKTIYIFYG